MNSFMGWIGGKRVLKNEIISRFPKDFERYIEVFGGAGWVLFGKQPSKFEVFNDADKYLINLYKQIKYNCDELQSEIDWIHSRELFNDYKLSLSTDNLTDVQRAARYYYIIKHSFGSNKDSFATSVKNNRVNILNDISKRLQTVIVENQDFERIIKTYDRENALFYCDPPYLNTEKYYSYSFSYEDHKRLYKALYKIKGKFILSYNDCELIRNMYKDYNIIDLSRQNQLMAGSNKREFKEILITNY